jgi:hypothetical protein
MSGGESVFGEVLASGLVAAAVGGVVSLIVVSITNKQSKNELYAQTVSSERMKWIENVRENLVELIVFCKTKDGETKDEQENSKKCFERCRANLLLRLHPEDKNQNGKKLEHLIDEMDFGQIDASMAQKIKDIGQKLLKKEWERVKAEAGETVKKREEIDFRKEELKLYRDAKNGQKRSICEVLRGEGIL